MEQLWEVTELEVCAMKSGILRPFWRKDEENMKRVVAHEQMVRNGQEEGMKPILLE